jgi:hypothetical protein
MPTTAIAGLDKAKAPQLRRASRILASTAIALMAWTFPRVGVFKLSEAFALISSPGLFFSVKSIVPILKCYWIFILATAISLVISVFMMGNGSITLLIQSGSSYLFFNPAIVVFSMLLANSTPLIRTERKQYFSLGSLMRFPFGVRVFISGRLKSSTS